MNNTLQLYILSKLSNHHVSFFTHSLSEMEGFLEFVFIVVCLDLKLFYDHSDNL